MKMKRKAIVRQHNHQLYEAFPDTEAKGKRKHLPPDVIREINHNSCAGGRAICDLCGWAYSANYVKRIISPNFTEIWACGYCRSTKGPSGKKVFQTK